MSSARLRKAFRYPDDSDNENEREELDEEEQERVIKHLKMQNDRRDLEYSIIFATLPLLSATVFLPSLFSGSSQFSVRVLSFLGVLSLAATAYKMKYLPPQRPDPKGKRPMRNPDLATKVRYWLLPLDTAVSFFMALVYFFSPEAGSSVNTWPIACLVPAAMLATVLVVQKVMMSVDLKALEELRYEYKGA